MGEFIDKAKGAANQVIGKGKAAAGRHTDNPKLAAKGTVQQAKGKLQTLAGEIEGKLGNKL